MAQKKFKYPLAITGDWKSLLPELKTLGYEVLGSRLLDTDHTYLVTNLLHHDDSVLASFNTLDPAVQRTAVDAADRDLVLALAAAVEGELFHPGELAIVTHNGASYTTHPDFKYKGSYREAAPENIPLQVVEHIDYTNELALHLQSLNNEKNYLVGLTSGSVGSSVRKATKEEIIDYFRNKTEKEIGEIIEKIFEAVGQVREEDYSPEIGGKAPNAFITSEEPVDTHISVRKAFIKELYDYSDDEVRESIEKELPSLFPRPTFSVGETLILFKDGTRKLMIIGSDDGVNEIALLELSDGLIKSDAITVEDTSKITEAELLEAGEGYGLARCNYAKFVE